MSYKVQDIMKEKVVTIKASNSVRNAAKMMNYRGISSLVVTQGSKIKGIITEKDLVTRVIANGADPQKTKIKDIMSQPVIIVHPEQTLESAVKVMLIPVTSAAASCSPSRIDPFTATRVTSPWREVIEAEFRSPSVSIR